MGAAHVDYPEDLENYTQRGCQRGVIGEADSIVWDGSSWCWVCGRCLGIAFGTPQLSLLTIGGSYAIHSLFLVRVGCCPCSVYVTGFRSFDSFILSLYSGSRTHTLCKGEVMIDLLDLYGLEHSIVFLATYHVLRTRIFCTFHFLCTLYNGTHYVVVGYVLHWL